MTPEQQAESDANLEKLIHGLWKHFDREPTEQEIVSFLYGTKEQREDIYNNKGLVK